MRNFKTQNRGMQKGKLPFLVKIDNMNALVEVAKIIRMHGLYPVPRNDIDKRSSQMDIAHRYLMKRERGADVEEIFDKLRSTMNAKGNNSFSAAVKNSVLGARHLSGNVYDPTTLIFFLCSYNEWLNKTHLAKTSERPIFEIGNWYGATVDPDNILNNLVMRRAAKDESSESMVKHMNELCITDEGGPRSLSTHAINIYVVKNGNLKRTEEFRNKWKCIGKATSPIMTINTNKKPEPEPPKRRKKSTKTKATKQQETPQVQTHTPPPSSVSMTGSPSNEPKGNTRTVGTKLPMTTPTQATQESSTKDPATPREEEVQCLDLLNKLSPLMKLCKEKKDIEETSQFNMALKGIMKYVENSTGRNYNTMEEATEELATTMGNEETNAMIDASSQENVNQQAPLRDLTKEEVLDHLNEFKDVHDPSDTMMLNAKASINQIMTSYGLQNSADVDPEGDRYKNDFIIMRYTKAVALWECYQGNGKQQSTSMSSLLETLSEIKERGWVISVEETKSKPLRNLVVISRKITYDHIKRSRLMRKSNEDVDASGSDLNENTVLIGQNENTSETTTSATGKDEEKRGTKRGGTEGTEESAITPKKNSKGSSPRTRTTRKETPQSSTKSTRKSTRIDSATKAQRREKQKT